MNYIDRNGIVYFMRLISIKNGLIYIPLEIRKLIWHYCFLFICNYCNNTLYFKIINRKIYCLDCNF